MAKSCQTALLEKNWNHEERFKIAVFVYIIINGVNPLILYEWVQLYGNINSKSARCHLTYLIQLFEEGIRYRKKYWGFNVAAGRYQYLDGSTRYYH